MFCICKLLLFEIIVVTPGPELTLAFFSFRTRTFCSSFLCFLVRGFLVDTGFTESFFFFALLDGRTNALLSSTPFNLPSSSEGPQVQNQHRTAINKSDAKFTIFIPTSDLHHNIRLLLLRRQRVALLSSLPVVLSPNFTHFGDFLFVCLSFHKLFTQTQRLSK